VLYQLYLEVNYFSSAKKYQGAGVVMGSLFLYGTSRMDQEVEAVKLSESAGDECVRFQR